MAQIFTIAHRKGGVGKTTLATNLAVALSNKGKTLLVDTDDQKSAYNWNEYRQEKLNSISVIDSLGKTLQPLNDEYEFILIDIAGRDSEVFREALLISDKLIVPTQASILDLELLPYIADKVTTAHKLNPELKAYIVINRANANPKNNEVNEAKKFIAKYNELTFSEKLLRLIECKGKKNVEIYKELGITKQHFSKIKNNPQYKPAKETALAFAIALHLSLEETLDLIGRAGFTLSHSSESDLIVEFFIMEGIYDVDEINLQLMEHGYPTLTNRRALKDDAAMTSDLTKNT